MTSLIEVLVVGTYLASKEIQIIALVMHDVVVLFAVMTSVLGRSLSIRTTSIL